jgi:hypothetical protein
MAMVANVIHRDKMLKGWMNLCTFTMDSSYPTGGETPVAAECGLSSIRYIIPQAPSATATVTASNLVPGFDRATGKMKLFGSPIRHVTRSFTRADMTDNGDTTGFIDLLQTIPASSQVLSWGVFASLGFTGDTSATIQCGVAGDLDRFSADTSKSVFTTNNFVGSAPLAADALDGMALIGSITPRFTITSAADFTNVAAGAAIATVYYYDTGAITHNGGLIELPDTFDVQTTVFDALVYGI